MGYHSYFALKVADYGMTVDEMMKLLDDTLATTKPLYDGLHCWAKNQLRRALQAAGAEADPGALDRQPLGAELAGPGRGGQPRSAVQGVVAREHRQERRELLRLARIRQAAAVVLGALATSTRCRPASRARRTATPRPGTSTARSDVRSLMSVEANEQWFGTSHHELGHIYYFLAYSRPEVPFLLREGANRAFHEAVGELAKLASQQTPYLTKIGVIPEGKAPDAARLAAAVGARLDRLPPLVGGHDEPLRARPLRDRAAARRMAGQVVGRTSPSSRGWRRPAAAIPSCATPAPRPTSTTTPPSTTTTRWRR